MQYTAPQNEPTPNPMMPVDRRHFRRFDLPLFAIMQYRDGEYHCTEAVSLINISAGGALIALEDDLPAGTPVFVRLISLQEGAEENPSLHSILPSLGKSDELPGVVLEPRDETRTVLGARLAVRFARPLAINSRLIPHHHWQKRLHSNGA